MMSWLKVDAGKPELLRAQHAALTTQVPLLYIILIINTSLLALMFRDTASAWLTVGFPAALAISCIVRIRAWLQAKRRHEPIEIIRNRLVRTIVLGSILGIAFLAWALALHKSGTSEQQGHVVFYIAITALCCIMSLMHLPGAAIAVTLVVAAPFTAYMVAAGGQSALNMSANLLAVMGVLVYVLHVYSRDFARMIDIQNTLEGARRDAAALGEENHRLANADALTGLANRRRFFAVFDDLLTERAQTRAPFAVGLVDLDGFKPINDGYGHTVGDEVLREVGARLERHGSKDVSFARLGGDEFAILASGDVDEASLAALAGMLCAELRQPYFVLGVQVEISATLGFAVYPDAGATIETLYERADYALYNAKQAGRGGMTIFSQELRQAQAEGKMLELALNRADLDSELSLDFQPIFDVEANRPTAFEALARWRSPTVGMVPPDRFIRVAERSGLIHRLTRVLLGKALDQARHWPRDIQLSFNLSMRDLTSREAMVSIVAIIEASGFPPERLILEITESAFMRDYEAATEAVAMLKRLGVTLSLDDFGTGYSSLSHVHQLPFDKLKIDRSFVRALGSNKPTHDVIRTILTLCQNLRLGCVVEGMETPGEVEALKALGCNTMQGYYFSRPVPADRVKDFFPPADRARDAA